MWERFYDIFYSLEEEEALDPLNETDIFCLQYVFIPRINKCLHDFVECWNNHWLSSEHCLTPYQLFLTGRLEEFRAESLQEHSHIQIPHYFRISDPVAVPRISFQPCQVVITMLELYINQLIPGSVDFGVTCYNQCVSLVGTHVTLCSDCTC